MSLASCYNLDTRLPRFSVRIALDQTLQLIDLMAFDAPEDLAKSAKISLVSHGGFVSGLEIGWRQGAALIDSGPVKAGERLVLAIGRDALMRAVATFRTQGDSEREAGFDIAFSTITETPQGTRASPRRLLQVTVLASASAPEWRVEPAEIDLDAPGFGKRQSCARIVVVVPKDIVLEPCRGLILELGVAGIDPLAVMLNPAAGADPSVSLRRYPDAGTGACRHLIWFSDATAVAGEAISLDVAIDRDAVIDFVDKTVLAGSSSGFSVRLTARMAGWFPQSGIAPEGPTSARPWRSALEARSIPIRSSEDAATALEIAGHPFAFSLADAPIRLEARAVLSAELDPDDESGAVHCQDVTVALRRWPLTRAAPLQVAIASRFDEQTIAEPSTTLIHDIVRDGALGRKGSVTVPLAALSRFLSDAVRHGGQALLDSPVEVEVGLSPIDDPHALVTVTLDLTYVRRIHRLPICIDLGASATAIWAGPARPADAPTQLKQLPLGAWLSRHVDPRHDEALPGPDEDGAAALIPSHIGLDSANHLRGFHAPSTLPDLALIGAGRASAAARIAAFGRRYDVSVPAPPHAGPGTATRRIGSLKAALTAGVVSLTLDEPVFRLDRATGRLVSTQTVEVAPLVADVLDELVDLYVLRLAEDRLRLDDAAPPPVAPRILIGRPSGIGQEIAVRYESALALFAQRLERHFPGASRIGDVVLTVPEAVAASRYFAGLPAITEAVTEQRDTLLVTLDIGGSGSDVAIARLRRDGGRIGCTMLATFGLPVGGQAIDEALIAVTAALIDSSMAAQGADWQPSFAETSLARACQRKDAAALSAQAWLAHSVQRAKVSLSSRILAKAEASGGAYRWDADAPNESFDLLLAEIDRDGRPSGLFVAQQLAPAMIGPGDADTSLVLEPPDETGTSRLFLKCRRRAIVSGGGADALRLAEISEALGTLLPRMARAAAHNPMQRPDVILAVSGRGALWPPLFEAVASEAKASGSQLAFERPLKPAMMKRAMVAGAAIIGMEGEAASLVAHPNPLAIAAMAVQMRDLGPGGLRTEFSAERIHYLGYDMGSGDRVHAGRDEGAPSLGGRVDLGRRFHFVRTVPGLDPQGRMLQRLRPLLGGEDPMVLLEGNAVVEAQREGIDAFGPCMIVSQADGPFNRKVTVTCVDEGWEGCWRIAHDRVVRIY